jgi:hypothetical protein
MPARPPMRHDELRECSHKAAPLGAEVYQFLCTADCAAHSQERVSSRPQVTTVASLPVIVDIDVCRKTNFACEGNQLNRFFLDATERVRQ